jgi:hypothetical protein
MKPLILALCVVFPFSGLSAQTPAWQPSAGHTQVPIWPGAVPDAQLVAGREVFARPRPFGSPETRAGALDLGHGVKAACDKGAVSVSGAPLENSTDGRPFSCPSLPGVKLSRQEAIPTESSLPSHCFSRAYGRHGMCSRKGQTKWRATGRSRE